MFLSAIWLSLCFSSLMYRFILPLVVLVPHDSNVAVDTQVWFRYSRWISSVAGISKIFCTSDVASATRLLICENVRHLRLGTNVSCVVCSKGSKIYAKWQSSRVRQQYGIFDSKSQTSFSRNATLAGSEEGRLFSQATNRLLVIFQIKIELSIKTGSLQTCLFREYHKFVIMMLYLLESWIGSGIGIGGSQGLSFCLKSREKWWQRLTSPHGKSFIHCRSL